MPLMRALDALARLREGNLRFVSQMAAGSVGDNHERRRELLAGQEPFAIILGCSDSRAPAEIVFDVGLGDLFVIRVAGNVVAPSQIGSVEFAAAQCGTRLVVVMGHTMCGAVLATIRWLETRTEIRSPSLRSIGELIRPAVEPLLETELRNDHEELVRQAVRANTRAAAEHLRHGSHILEDLIRNDGLLILEAEYSLETGIVEFFDSPPADR
jgi:carbonic anhydrase